MVMSRRFKGVEGMMRCALGRKRSSAMQRRCWSVHSKESKGGVREA